MNKRQVTEELQSLLVEVSDLALIAKQAHWNVQGPRFLPVHQQLDTLTDEVRAASDDVAERISALDGTPDARAATVAAESPFSEFPSGRISDDKVVELVVERLDQVIQASRGRIERLDDLDLVSQDLVIGIVAGLEKQRWMFAAQRA
jgi:starvation-inducible DNA-binding protein